MQNYERHIAEQFILHTSKNVFLTGRAGTGKTTFLQNIVKKTNKNTVVVAPTGVAAINAKGVTIHSMFQLPLTAFIPSYDNVDLSICTNRFALTRHMKYRSDRRKLFETLELLIIDEISMVRADLLDAIDFILKRIRKNTAPFGGIQLLVIGDLFQLSPVVKHNIWPILKPYYKSPFFFDSLAWAQSSPIKIELLKIYRQKDKDFISILNNIRLGIRKIEDLEVLNKNFKPINEDDDILTLTTHNNKADKINGSKMDRLPSRKRLFTAEIRGKFNESAYPVPEVIKLKKGAQVMFIRNDTDGMYFNGKIGVIEDFSGDIINVKCPEDDYTISVEQEEWKNTKYTINKEDKTIEQTEIGSFEQYPLKLAWAITIHKSQGLTFDEVSVDLSQTFAPGQMYVALSRSRTLEGLSLRTKVKLENIITDKRILEYHTEIEIDENVEIILKKAQEYYGDQQLIKAFHFGYLLNQLEEWKEIVLENKIPEQGNAFIVYKNINNSCVDIHKIGRGFQTQLTNLLNQKEPIENIKERSLKAIDYFTQNFHQKIILVLEEHISTYKIKKGTRKYIRVLNELRTDLWSILDKLYQLEYREKKLFTKKRKHVKSKDFKVSGKPGKVKKTVVKGETQKITFELFKSGKSLKDIAEARNLKLSTIQGHMVRWIEKGMVDITKLMDKKKINVLSKEMKGKEEVSFTEIMKEVSIETSFSELRWVRAYLLLKE